MIKSIDEVFEPLVAQAILNLVSKGATITGDGRDIGAEVRDRAAEINERYETWRQEHGSQPTLARRLQHYLDERQHVLSTAHLSGMEQLLAEADYVLGEAQELHTAVQALDRAYAAGDEAQIEAAWGKVCHEIADVTLADTTLAELSRRHLRPGLTVEDCISRKTISDKGRG